LECFLKNKKVISPIFWEVEVTPKWFEHIEWSSKRHLRPMQEAYIRYLCFLNMVYIIENSYLYQEYRKEYKKIKVKWKNKKYVVTKLIKYYWLVAVVNWDKQRIKIVLRYIEWRSKFEFVSVIPYWKSTKNWPKLYEKLDI
jgi:hypothetical protein